MLVSNGFFFFFLGGGGGKFFLLMFFDFSILKWSQRKFEKIESSNIYVVEIYDNKEHFPNLLSHIIDLCTLGTQKSNFYPTKNIAKIATFFTPPPATRIIGFHVIKLIRTHALMHEKSFFRL